MKAFPGDDGNSWVKTIGIYLILILAVLRLIVYPLHITVKDKQAAHNDLQRTYATKIGLQEKLQQIKKDGQLRKRQPDETLYPPQARIAEVQADMLSGLSEMAVKKGLAVSGFETPEAIAGKRLSEVNVVIKLKGNVSSLLEMLNAIAKQKKTLIVKTMEITHTALEMNFVLTVSAFRKDV